MSATCCNLNADQWQLLHDIFEYTVKQSGIKLGQATELGCSIQKLRKSKCISSELHRIVFYLHVHTQGHYAIFQQEWHFEAKKRHCIVSVAERMIAQIKKMN